jgi:hypothetical protein
MTKFLKKYSVIIGFIVSFILDAKYQILEKLITDPFWLNIAKGLGAVILAYFTGSKLVSASKDELTDIGGGGIKNPKP